MPAPPSTAKKVSGKAPVKAKEEEKSAPAAPPGGSFAKKGLEKQKAAAAAPTRASVKAQPEEDGLFITVQKKDKREQQDSRTKYALNEVKGDHVERLQNYCTDIFGQKFSDQMFAKSQDFPKHIKCLEAIQKLIENQPDELLEVLDIIFKWTNLRVNDSSNTKLLLSVFDLYGALIAFMGEREYKLREFEALVMIGTLCEKTGNGSKTLVEKARKLLKESMDVYEKKEWFRILVNQGVKSKN